MLYTDEEIRRLKTLHPGRVFVVIKKSKNFKYNWYSKTSKDTFKLIVNRDTPMTALKSEIYKILKSLNGNVPIIDAIYLSNGESIVSNCYMLMSEIEERYGKRGILYLTIHSESTFG